VGKDFLTETRSRVAHAADGLDGAYLAHARRGFAASARRTPCRRPRRELHGDVPGAGRTDGPLWVSSRSPGDSFDAGPNAGGVCSAGRSTRFRPIASRTASPNCSSSLCAKVHLVRVALLVRARPLGDVSQRLAKSGSEVASRLVCHKIDDRRGARPGASVACASSMRRCASSRAASTDGGRLRPGAPTAHAVAMEKSAAAVVVGRPSRTRLASLLPAACRVASSTTARCRVVVV
jgi:hypothetical protein